MEFIKHASLWVGVPLFSAYFTAMVICPIVTGVFDWQYIQQVWHSWQTLNAGMIALFSSVVALNISRINANEERKREFVAAKAFLPAALSELTHYFENCVVVLVEAWPRVTDVENHDTGPLESAVPDLPEEFRNVFRECIRHADGPVAERLALVLSKIQIHRSRFLGYVDMFKPESDMVPTLGNGLNYFYDIAELYALVSMLFDFARGGKFDDPKPTLKDFHNAYNNFEMHSVAYVKLFEYTNEKFDT